MLLEFDFSCEQFALLIAFVLHFVALADVVGTIVLEALVIDQLPKSARNAHCTVAADGGLVLEGDPENIVWI